jgi:ribose/xylose/arabinose/galactoside ABC-type transport system permease subunit
MPNEMNTRMKDKAHAGVGAGTGHIAPDPPALAGGEAKVATPAPPARRNKASLMDFAEKWATLIGFALMAAFFWISEPSTFGTVENLKSILDQAAVPILLGVGLTVVLAVSEFDLAFPYALGLSSAAATLMMTDQHASTLVAVLVGILVAVVAGAITGVFVAQQRVSSFVITLGFGFVWLGITDGLTNSSVISSGLNTDFIDLTSHRLLGLTLATWVAAVFALAIAVMFRWTVLGRYLMSVGSNPLASRLAGLRLSGLRVTAYAVLGIGVGIAAVIITSRQAQYTPAVGAGLFLSPYVAAFFGMSVLAARRFNVFGTVVGALFMGTLQTGLVIVGASAWLFTFIQGAVLLVILLIARRAA